MANTFIIFTVYILFVHISLQLENSPRNIRAYIKQNCITKK